MSKKISITKGRKEVFLSILNMSLRKQRYFPHYVESRQDGVDKDGRGIFAKRDIEEGKLVAQLGGVLVHTSQVPQYLEQVGNYGPQVHDDWYVSPTSVDEVAQTGAINHSCNPNIGMLDALTFVAMQDIQTGKELTCDYAMTGLMQGFDCNCQEDACRSVISPEDWKIAELQEKYAGFFSPHRQRLMTPDLEITCQLTMYLDLIGKKLPEETDRTNKKLFFIP